MASTTGRRVVEYLTNKSGGGVIAGDVVVVDTTNNEAFTTTTTGGFLGTIGVAQETIASNAAGRVLTAGYAALVNVNASVTRGNYGKTYTVAKQATDLGASRSAGAFCQFLIGGTTPSAHLFGIADASTSSSGVPSGTSNPVSPSDGDLFYRTDLALLIRYHSSGTRWMTVQEYSTEIAAQDTLIGTTSSPQTQGYAEINNRTYDTFITNAEIGTTVSTTNNGTNYWTVTLARQPSATTVRTFNTSADTAGTHTRHGAAVNATTGTSDTYFGLTATKTLTPGALYAFATVYYRLIIT